MRRRGACAVSVLLAAAMAAIPSCSQPSGGSGTDSEQATGGSESVPEGAPPFQLMEAYRFIEAGSGSPGGGFPNGVLVADRYDFGSIVYGYAVVSISNKGSGPVNIQSITLTEGTVEDFEVSMQKTESLLQPNTETPFELWFDAAKTDFTGKASAQVVIATDKGKLKLGVEGGDTIGKPPLPPPRPSMFVFLHQYSQYPAMWFPACSGQTTLGYLGTAVDGLGNKKDGPWSLEINNRGVKNLNIMDMSLKGNGSGDFVLSGFSIPESIPPGEKRVVKIFFDPLTEGQRTATLTITDDSDYTYEGNYDIALQGKGLKNESKITLTVGTTNKNLPNGGTVDMGSCRIDTPPPPDERYENIVVENLGAGDLKIDIGKIEKTGDLDDFYFDTAACDPVVPPGASPSNALFIVFKPKTEGAHQLKVTIPNNDPDDALFKFTIKGTGVAP
jgi:trimeric autotransporter adhesin